MEGLIFIFLFIVTFLSSLKLISDLYLDTTEDGKGIMHIDISNLNNLVKDIPPLKFFFEFIFGGASVILLILLLMIAILMYIYKVTNKDFIIFCSDFRNIFGLFYGDQQVKFYIFLVYRYYT